MVRVPDYYGAFRCLAGDCPHSCCEAWEVVLDPETAARYRTVPGPLGEKLRRAMTEREGEVCFALDGGRCPFLDGENLCQIHRLLGEEATSRTCRSHPRFTEEYGPVREITLSASCPAANALLLAPEEPLRFPVTEAGGGVPAELRPLYALREACLELLAHRALPLGSRLAWLLLLANEAQAALDEGEEEDLYGLAEAAASLPAETGVAAEGEGLFPAALEVLGELECLGRDWPALLEAGRSAPGLSLEDHAPALERTCAYFLFRWFCKAVADGDLLSRVELAVLGTLTAARLGSLVGLGEALRLFSREVEHSVENLLALQQAFCADRRLSLGRFLAELA